MQEQLISFETAKLAKEKGFDFKVYKEEKIYDKLGYLLKPEDEVFPGVEHFPASSQSLLQKWLREVHGINIFMTFKPNIKKWDFIPYLMNMNAKEYIEYNSNYTKQNNERRFDTYEEALEIGLQEALKLI